MMYDAEDKYADIIHLPHHVSRNHPQMRMADCTAQFSPFAALTGHDAAISEAARLTDEQPILDESVKQEISDLLQLASTDSNLVLNLVYFVPDSRKAGGAYMEITGRIKKLIPHEKLLIMDTGTRIPVEDVVEVTASYRFNDSRPLVQSVLPKES